MNKSIIDLNTKFQYQYIYQEPFQKINNEIDSLGFGLDSWHALQYQQYKTKNQ